MNHRLMLIAVVCALGCTGSSTAQHADERSDAGGVTVYLRSTFEDGQGSWVGANGAKLSISDDGALGKALEVLCQQKFSGAEVPLQVSGSAGLKLAYHMKANLYSVGLNVYDQVAGDNTTAYGPRYLTSGQWVPVLYRLDRFRYNSNRAGFVKPNTRYAGLRFYGPMKPQEGARFLVDNLVLYRGNDTQPPDAVTGVVARATSSGVSLKWQAAEDNVATMVYVISRSKAGAPFQKIAETTQTEFVDASAGSATYHYRILAVDFEENLGPWSEVVEVDSTASPQKLKVSPEVSDRFGYAARIRMIHARGRGKVHRGHVTLFGDSLTGATLYPRFCESALLNVGVDAFGFPGRKSSFGRQRVNDILQRTNPEFVFILFGTNNAKAAQNNVAAMADLQAIVAACERNGSVAVLGTIPPRGFRDPRSLPEAQYNQQVQQLCRQMKIPVAYIFESIQSSGARRQFLAGDGIHWKESGMEVAARSWGRTLEQIRFALRDRPDGEESLPEETPPIASVERVPSEPAENTASHEAEPSAPSNDVQQSVTDAEDATHGNHSPDVCPTCGFKPPRTRFAQTVENVQQLKQAITTARPDTTIWMKPGVYQLGETLDIRASRVVLRSVDGDPRNVFIVGQGMSDRRVGVALSISGSNITVAGISIGRVGFHAIQVRGELGVRNAMFHNLHVFETGQQLLKGSVGKNGRNSHDCIVACSLFSYENGAPGNYTNGVDVLGGRGWVVRDNVFRNIHGPLDKRGACGPAILFWRDCRDTVVQRNVILDCYRGIALGLVPQPETPLPQGAKYYDHTGGVIENNIVWNLNEWGNEGIELNAARDVRVDFNTVYITGDLPWSIGARFPTTTALIRNNLSNRRIMRRDGGQARERGNVTDARADWFVDVKRPDLRLTGKHTDPIDKGVVIDDVHQDFRLSARQIGSRPDAGAIEFVPEGDRQ